uniref:Uncharacterized protein n=1 Tax=Clytia hemisphaerica TaxID=252671 RepID=A0A7M6DQN1_9CNID
MQLARSVHDILENADEAYLMGKVYDDRDLSIDYTELENEQKEEEKNKVVKELILSLQEMEFPPTPIGERKLSPAPGKSHFSTKQLPKRMASQDLDDSHRSYETIEQLRARLKQNYLEAKRQREKYLNLSPTRKKDSAKNLNGYRSKTQQQPVFKNYKQKSEVQERTNGVVKFDNQLSVNGVRTNSPNDQSTSELSQALSNKKTTSDREIIPTVYLGDQSNLKSRDSTSNLNGFSKQESFDQHRSPPPKTSEKPQGYKTNNASKSTVKSPKQMHQMSRDNSIDLDRPSNQNPGSTNLTRKNSLKNLVKRSDSRSSIKKDIKRSPEINHNDIDNVLTNHNINDDISKKKIHHEEVKGEEEGNEFDVMDMLANW